MNEEIEDRIAQAAASPAGFETRRLRAAVIDAVLERDPAPLHVGRYVVLEAAGRGAMSDVYRAYDPKLGREVALKLLRLRLGEREDRARARLLREAQAMARLSHPNVAAIYDVELEGDALYIAMEFVRGTTLQKWLAAPRAWRDVLARFVSAARGLAAAHDEGLLHCDFKPANVLVGDDGRVRVTDFGIARLAASEHEAAALPKTAAASTRVTSTGAVFGTPIYMAPEQHAGGKLGPAADQYSFCVALWEALVGTPPFIGTLAVLAERKRGGPPPWPARLDVPRFVGAAIVRGLSAQATDRWSSMVTLADALQRALGKSRSRLLLPASGIAILGIGGAAIASQRDAPCTASDAAMGEAWDAARRDAVEQAIASTHVAYADDLRARVVPAIDAYADAWKAMHTDACLATNVRGEQTGAVMELRMACLHRASVELDAATRVLVDVDAASLERADAIVAALPSLDRCADVASLQAELAPPARADADEVDVVRARLAEAAARRRAGRYDAAAQSLANADELAAAIDYGPLRTELELERGRIAEDRGEPEAAEPAEASALRSALQWDQAELAFDAAVDLVGNAAGRDHGDAGEAYASVAWGLLERQPAREVSEARLRHAIAGLRESQGRYAEQEQELQGALALRIEALGPDDPSVASTQIQLGLAAYNQSHYDDAVALIREALAKRTAAIGAEHPDVGRAHIALATALHGQQRFADAEAASREALRIGEASLGPQHPNVADARNNIAMALSAQGKHAEAEAELRRVLSIREALGDPQRYEVARLRVNLGNAALGQGRAVEAEADFRAALAIGEALFGEKHRLVAMTRDSLAEAIRLQGGRDDEAEAEWKRALAVAREVLEPHHVAVARTHARYARLLFEQGRTAESIDQYRAAVEGFEHSLGATHPETSIPRWFLAKALRVAARSDEALAQLQQLWSATHGDGYTDPERGEAAFALAQLQWDMDRDRGTARKLAERARALYAANSPEHAPALVEIDAWLAKH